MTDENGRDHRIMLRVSSLAYIIVEEDAPADFYDLPLRSISHLRQLSTARDLTRVRVFRRCASGDARSFRLPAGGRCGASCC